MRRSKSITCRSLTATLVLALSVLCARGTSAAEFESLTPTAKPERANKKLALRLERHAIPAFIVDDSPPLPGELLAWDAERTLHKMGGWIAAAASHQTAALRAYHEHWYPMHRNNTPLSDAQDLLKILEPISEPATFLFVGGGMQIASLVARGLFDGTAMEERVLFIPVSRPLTGRANAEAKLDRLYEFLQLQHRPGNLVVIDSTRRSDGHTNSVLQITQSVRRFLLRRGETADSVLPRVVAMALRENRIPGAPADWNSTRTLAEYRAALDHSLDWNKTRPTTEQPYLETTHHDDSGFRYWHSSIHSWSGKLQRVDGRGLPVGGWTASQALDEAVAKRVTVAMGYKGILEETTRLRDETPSLRAATGRAVRRYSGQPRAALPRPPKPARPKEHRPPLGQL